MLRSAHGAHLEARTTAVQPWCQCGGRRIRRQAELELGLGFTLAPRLALAQTDAAHERPPEGDLLVVVDATPPAPLKPDGFKLDAKPTFAGQWVPRLRPCATLAAQQTAVAAPRPKRPHYLGRPAVLLKLRIPLLRHGAGGVPLSRVVPQDPEHASD